MTFIRKPYDFRLAQRLIIDNGLPEKFARRLAVGRLIIKIKKEKRTHGSRRVDAQSTSRCCGLCRTCVLRRESAEQSPDSSFIFLNRSSWKGSGTC